MRFLILVALCLSPAAVADSEGVLRLAVRTADSDLTAALADGPFQRFVLPNRQGLALEVGAEAKGDVLIEACRVSDRGAAPALARRLSKLPAALHGDALELGGSRYHDRDLALAVRLPAARHWIVCGFETAPTASLVDRVLLQEAGFRGGDPVDYLLHEHDFSQRSGRWQVTERGVELDPGERDDPAHRRASYASMPVHRRPHVVLKVPPAAARDPRAPALADRLEQMVTQLSRRLGSEIETPVEVLVEEDHVSQGRHTGDLGAAVISRGRLHLVYHPDDLELYRYELARLLVRRAGLEVSLGPSPMLEDGAALWLAETWYGRRFDNWLEDLAFGDVLPSAGELTARRRPGDGSAVLWPPVAAAVIDRLPGETLAAKLRGRLPAGHLDSALTAIRGPASTKEATRPNQASPIPFQRGISLAMANGLEIGYHAPAIDDQLERLRQMGADAVSLMPFAYQRRPAAPQLAFLNRSPSSETDTGVVHAARRAREHGFYVLWKPHIWISYDSWPGEIEMQDEADWAAWWKSYRRYILHHAVLARAAGADMLSLGVELGRTVSREAEWRHLVAAVRRVFPGPLTYSGNWWDDYDKVPFWNALDAVGVDAYFPLAGSEQADDAALRAGAERIASQLAADARRFGKPILLTEVGFAARRGAWISPHEEGGELSEEHQRRAWGALLGALDDADWLRGLYAWKVFSHERAEHTSRPDFRWLERPAAGELERWFKEPPRSDP